MMILMGFKDTFPSPVSDLPGNQYSRNHIKPFLSVKQLWIILGEGAGGSATKLQLAVLGLSKYTQIFLGLF